MNKMTSRGGVAAGQRHGAAGVGASLTNRVRVSIAVERELTEALVLVEILDVVVAEVPLVQFQDVGVLGQLQTVTYVVVIILRIGWSGGKFGLVLYTVVFVCVEISWYACCTICVVAELCVC